MHGPNMSDEHAVTAHYCKDAGVYVFATVDGVSTIKMVGATLARLEASSAPSNPTPKYFVPAPKATVNLKDKNVVCNLWAGKGYKTEPYHLGSYLLKNVKVDQKLCGGTVGSWPCSKPISQCALSFVSSTYAHYRDPVDWEMLHCSCSEPTHVTKPRSGGAGAGGAGAGGAGAGGESPTTHKHALSHTHSRSEPIIYT